MPKKTMYTYTSGTLTRRHTMFAEVTAEYVDPTSWTAFADKLGVKSFFLLRSAAESSAVIFKVTVQNGSTKPIAIRRASILAGERVFEAHTTQAQHAEFSRESYGISDPKRLFVTRKLHTTDLELSNIKPGVDTTICDFAYVIPGDTVMYFVTFDPLSLGGSSFVFRVPLLFEGEEKRVDFEFESRTVMSDRN